MPVCSFCKNSYKFPRGTTVVQKDGNIKYYCTSKCRKNSEMGRDNKKVKWVRKSAIAKEEAQKKEEAKQARAAAKQAEKEAKASRKKKVKK